MMVPENTSVLVCYRPRIASQVGRPCPNHATRRDPQAFPLSARSRRDFRRWRLIHEFAIRRSMNTVELAEGLTGRKWEQFAEKLKGAMGHYPLTGVTVLVRQT